MKNITEAFKVTQEVDIALISALDSVDHIDDASTHTLALTMIYTKLLDFMQTVADQLPHETVLKIMLVKEAGLDSLTLSDKEIN